MKGQSTIAYLARHLSKNLAKYKAGHATDVVYWIHWHGVQGNMELTANELGRLVEIKVPVAMDYIQTKHAQIQSWAPVPEEFSDECVRTTGVAVSCGGG